MDGLFSGGDIVDSFVNGLHEAFKAKVVSLHMIKRRVILPDAVTTGQIEWTGIQQPKIGLRCLMRHTTTPVRASTVVHAPPLVATSIMPQQPPRFARLEQAPGPGGVAPTPRTRSTSTRRQPEATDLSWNCQ